jgi:hypothetical protein
MMMSAGNHNDSLFVPPVNYINCRLLESVLGNTRWLATDVGYERLIAPQQSQEGFVTDRHKPLLEFIFAKPSRQDFVVCHSTSSGTSNPLLKFACHMP